MLAASGVVALALTAAAAAAWPLTGAGSGSTRALSLATGPTPTAGAITGTPTRNVPLSWPAVAGAAGYVIKRYDNAGLPSVIAGTCTGIVTATSCVDQTGPVSLTWRYSVQATNGLWVGPEGPTTTVTT